MIRLYEIIVVYKDILEKELSELCAYLLSKCHSGTKVAPPFVTPVNVSDIRINQCPEETIVKMAKRAHVDQFFEDGTLQLGTVRYYAKDENSEIGDPLEDAAIVLIGKRPGYTAASAAGGGYNHYVYCTYLGKPDEDTLKKFGYDSGYVITDPVGFSEAIKRSLNATRADFGRCAYTEHRAIVGSVDDDFILSTIDHKVIEMVGEGRNYLKPIQFSHQNEFRFTWKVTSDTDAPLIIKCPEAVEFAKKL